MHTYYCTYSRACFQLNEGAPGAWFALSKAGGPEAHVQIPALLVSTTFMHLNFFQKFRISSRLCMRVFPCPFLCRSWRARTICLLLHCICLNGACEATNIPSCWIGRVIFFLVALDRSIELILYYVLRRSVRGWVEYEEARQKKLYRLWDHCFNAIYLASSIGCWFV